MNLFGCTSVSESSTLASGTRLVQDLEVKLAATYRRRDPTGVAKANRHYFA